MTPGIDLPQLIEQFGSEDKCHDYLEDLRWPDGVECPRCESKKISRIARRRQFECSDCRFQFSVRVGTIFHDSKLPLWKWFLAVYMMCESRKGVSANQLKRMLGVSYKTAWYLCHRIRSTMVEEGGALLDGIVEADETYVGGKRHGSWGTNKTMVTGVIQRDGLLRVQAQPSSGHHLIREFVAENVSPDAEAIYTDEHRAYDDLPRHKTVKHSEKEWVRGKVHTNTVESAWSLFDRAVIGAYHNVSKKHLQAYLDEFAFRFNNRENPFLFRDTILKLVEGDALPFTELTHPQR